MRIRLVEDHHIIHAGEGRQHLGALGLGINGTSRFEVPHRRVAVDSDDQTIAQRFSLLEKASVADMQEIETSVREYDSFASRSVTRYGHWHIRRSQDFRWHQSE